jgi:hypothetical protein
MVTGILIEGQTLPDTGVLTVQVDRTIEIGVSAVEAQREVSVFVLTEIGNLLHGEAPILVVGERVVWRVSVHLTRPSFGNLGQVGHVDVDVQSGELLVGPETISLIERNAENLVERLALLSRSEPIASSPRPRVAGLHRGAIRASDDF